MFEIELTIVLLIIYLGARLGSIGIGITGGLGVFILTFLFDNKPGDIPFDVIKIIIAVVTTIATMQVAGGIDYLINISERLLRKHPKHITFLAPIITWFMTVLTGTGHISLSIFPVIIEISKEYNIRPSRPLSIAVIASQIGITASPTSAAVLFFANILEPTGISYLTLLSIFIPINILSIVITAIVCNYIGSELKDNLFYEQRLSEGKIKLSKKIKFKKKPYSKLSVILFFIGIIAIIFYAIATSDNIKLIKKNNLSRNDAIIIFMLTTATFISTFCKIDTKEIINSKIFKSGMSACVCILGAAWMGDTFIKSNILYIQSISSNLLYNYPWFLSIILLLASNLLYSQAATTKALIPAALMLGVNPITIIASFSAVSALFIIPTYPTLLAAIEMDDTGSTYIGKYFFNHTFLVPGIIAVTLCVIFGFILSNIII